MRIDQIEIAYKIKQEIKSKGLMISFIASKFGMTTSRMSRILSGTETYVSDDLIDKIFNYIKKVNTNVIEI